MEDITNVLSGDMKSDAKRALAGNWGKGVLVVVIYMAISIFASFIPIIGQVAIAILAGPILLGLAYMVLNLIRTNDADIEDLFFGFSSFGDAFVIALLRWLIIFAWSILAVVPMIGMAVGAAFMSSASMFLMVPLMFLLYIPGIMAYYSYSMVFYIKVDHPEMTATEILKASKEMMQGNKMKLFLLHLSFIGWFILMPFTLFIGYLWLLPYLYVTMGVFYKYVSKGYVPSRQETYEEF